MLNVNKHALTNAKRIVDHYKEQNRRIYQEARSAYKTIKAACDLGCKYEYSEKQKYIFNGKEISQKIILWFTDPNGYDLDVSFNEFIEIQVAEAFHVAYRKAQSLNNFYSE